jgi:RNA polymerase sigma-70 factor (ECF subfamily)
MGKENSKNIIDLIRSGDQLALKKVYDDNRIAFIKFSRIYNVKTNDALDIYQDAIIILYDNIVNGKITELSSKISTYLFAIGKYKIFQLHRDNAKVELKSELFVEEENIYLDVDLHNEKLTNQQELLNKYYSLLGNRCKEILKLFYYEGYTLDEIIDILDYSDKKVLKSQKSRCIKQLKDWIKESYE